MGHYDEVLSVEEAARLLKVPPATVRREARAGRLPGRHVGKEWRFAHSALIDWLRGEIDGPGVPPARYARTSGEPHEPTDTPRIADA